MTEIQTIIVPVCLACALIGGMMGFLLGLGAARPYCPKALHDPRREEQQRENERLREVLGEAMAYACHDDECEVSATGRCNCWCVSARSILKS